MILDLALQILGFTTGILYLWWEYHVNDRLWLASIIMPAINIWLYLDRGLYADFAINIYYFFIAVYGYLVWRGYLTKRSHAHTEAPPISHIHGKALIGATAVFAILWLAIWSSLHWFTNSNVPVADAFTTALSIVAMWMLARKYLEQWIAWFAVDAVSVGLYIYKGIYLNALLYIIYTVIAGFGYLKWRRTMLSPSDSPTR